MKAKRREDSEKSTEQVHIKHISVSCFKYRSNFDERRVDERPLDVLAEINRSRRGAKKREQGREKAKILGAYTAQGVRKQVTSSVS